MEYTQVCGTRLTGLAGKVAKPGMPRDVHDVFEFCVSERAQCVELVAYEPFSFQFK